MKLLEATLDAVRADRPPADETPQRLCADAGYVGEPARKAMIQRGYVPHVRPKGKPATRRNPGRRRARRWVVERLHSWLNRFRKLLVRFEKDGDSHEALIELACALICFRQVIIIHG